MQTVDSDEIKETTRASEPPHTLERKSSEGHGAEGVEDKSTPHLAKGFSLGGALFCLIAILALAGLVAFGALPRFNQQEALVKHTQAQNAELPAVSVVEAQAGPAVQEFSLPGATQAIQDAMIYARVDGYIHARYVDIGNHVKAGQILADIDTPELDKQVQAAASAVEQAKAALENNREALAKSKADLKTAEANVRKATTDLNYYTLEVGRYKRLAGMGAVSVEDSDTRTQAYQGGEANLDSMRAAGKSAEAAVNSAAAAVHVAQAALDAAQAQHDQYAATRSFKKVTALFDGVITQRNVDAGALVTSGSNSTNTVLFEIAKTDVLRIFVYVPEQYVPYVHEGEKATIQVQEYPGKDFVGTVTHVAGGLDPTSKTLQVEIHVPNGKHVLLPGMYTKVLFEAPAVTRLAIVPATTVKARSDGSFVYSVDAQNIVHLNKVDIGRDLGGQFEIIKGVKAGDKVIVSPSDDVHDGLHVSSVLAPAAEKSSSK